jgi:hypothetical protein
VWGDFITVGLLMFDVSLAVWEFQEQKNIYLKEMTELQKALNDIDLKKKALKHTDQDYERRLKLLNLQQNTLERALKKYTKEWQYLNITLIASLVYALSLTLAFLLATLPFFPATLPLVPLTITGTILCFALTVMSNVIKSGVEIYKAQQTLAEIKKDATDKLQECNRLQTKEDKKDLFLELKLLMIEHEYQEQQKGAQTLLLIQSIALQLLVPTLIFSSLVFLPPGLGLLVLAVGLALMSQVNQLLHKRAVCQRKELEAFDEDEYEHFIKSPEGYYQSGPAFFSQNKKAIDYQALRDTPPEAFCAARCDCR